MRPNLYDTFAAHHPAQTALVYQAAAGSTRSWSYAELAGEVRMSAAALAERGVGPGERLVACLQNHPDLVRLLLAASYGGSVLVPADPRLTVRELAHYVAVSEPRLAIGRPETPALREVAHDANVPYIDAGAPIEDPVLSSRSTPLQQRDCEDVVELLFTSGTTRSPKAVMLTNASLLHGARALARGARYTVEDRPLIALPLHHAGAQIHQLLPTYVLGGTAVVAECFDPGSFFEQARRHGATTTAQFAATLRMLLRRGDHAAARRSRMRHVTFAQSLTRAEYAEWDRKIAIPLQQLWGMTETSGLPLMSPLDRPRRLEAMGVPVEGFYEVEIRTFGGRPAAAGEVGELVVRAKPGQNVMRGYFRNPEATAETIRDGSLRTGDLSYRDDDGYYFFVGRGRDLIRRAGQNFSALEVEQVLLEHPGVADAAVVGVPDDLADEKPVAFVVATGTLSVRELREHCRRNLAIHKRPSVIHLVDALPRTAVGKIQKHLLLPGS